MAKETYRKLSLLNPEKSVYFAKLIAELDGEAAAERISEGKMEAENN